MTGTAASRWENDDKIRDLKRFAFEMEADLSALHREQSLL